MDRRYPTIFQKNTQEVVPTRSSLLGITIRPGVYLYKDASGGVLYVGKAKNLRNRIRQYFVRADALGAKTGILVPQIRSIQTIATDSEFDAILLESELIRQYMPKYNSISKDDKSPLFMALTLDESLPRIFLTRKTAIDSLRPIPKNRRIVGPFQSAPVARLLLQSIRRVIPYCSQKQRTGAPCFYTHLGLCNPCPSAIIGMPDSPEKKRLQERYRHQMRSIALVLSGRGSLVRRELEKTMSRSAAREEYEAAGAAKQQLASLNRLLTHAFDPVLYKDAASQPGRMYEERLSDLSRVLMEHGVALGILKRIECIDISTIQGSWPAGSLVVFTDGIPDTGSYRRFRIRAGGRPNDVAMMGEVVTRRLAHPKWGTPDLIIVDGGKPQVGAAVKAVQATPAAQKIPIVGLAKRYEELIIPGGKTDLQPFQTIRLAASRPAIQLLEHIRDEAHRFAKKYHTLIRQKSFGN